MHRDTSARQLCQLVLVSNWHLVWRLAGPRGAAESSCRLRPFTHDWGCFGGDLIWHGQRSCSPTRTGMPTVSSAPHASLRPVFRRLASDRGFALLATETQFAMLVEAVAEQFEHHAAMMRDYTPAARAALLGHLRKVEEQRPGAREVELWTAEPRQQQLAVRLGSRRSLRYVMVNQRVAGPVLDALSIAAPHGRA